MLQPCEECGHEISEHAERCPHCGATPARVQKLQTRTVIYVVIIVAAILASIFLRTGS